MSNVVIVLERGIPTVYCDSKEDVTVEVFDLDFGTDVTFEEEEQYRAEMEAAISADNMDCIY